jgi:N4-gp56 family major capsid protein
MSTTTFSTSSNLALKVWAKKAYTDGVKPTLFAKLTGKGDRAIVQVKDELKKSPGDKITFGLRALPTGVGVQDDETLEGQEEGLVFKDFAVYLGEKRYATKVDLNLSAQRTLFDVKQEAKDAVSEWLEEYIDTTFFEYLTGIGQGSTTSISKYHPNGVLGGNTLNTPTSSRLIFAGTATTRATLTSTDYMSLSVLDSVALRLKRASPSIRKGQFDGKSAWVVIMSPEQVHDLRASTTTGQWFDIQKACLMGGKVDSSPIWTEALGMYRDMILIESTRIPTFTNGGAGANLPGARALVLGAQSAVVAYGQNTDGWGKMELAEKTFDYGKRYGVAATLIWGMQKSKFTSQEDFAVVAVETSTSKTKVTA